MILFLNFSFWYLCSIILFIAIGHQWCRTVIYLCIIIAGTKRIVLLRGVHQQASTSSQGASSYKKKEEREVSCPPAAGRAARA